MAQSQKEKQKPRNDIGQYANKHTLNSGDKFHRLTVIREVGKIKGKRRFLCQCDCGNEKIIRLEGLIRQTSKSCGCLRSEITSMHRSTHGQRQSRLYGTWQNMKNRCLNKNVATYKRYGARGITVCNEWMEFEPFYRWAMANGYQDNLTIERINNAGNYEPKNCVWVAREKQATNKRNNLMVTYNGETKCLAEWSRLLGLNYSAVLQRIRKLNWPADKAFNTPA